MYFKFTQIPGIKELSQPKQKAIIKEISSEKKINFLILGPMLLAFIICIGSGIFDSLKESYDPVIIGLVLGFLVGQPIRLIILNKFVPKWVLEKSKHIKEEPESSHH